MEKAKKVFCIGFMKTGTTSLNRALHILGHRVSHDSWKWLPWIVRGEWHRIEAEVAKWDAFEDNPIPLIFEELDQRFPGSKFILSTRDSAQWYQSVRYHIGTLRSPMHEWVFGSGKGLPMEDPQHTIDVFESHIERVKNYFKDRPQDLMVVDVTKGMEWETLCKFLGEPIPDQPFPHANPSNFKTSKWSGPRARLKLWRKRLSNPLKVWFYKVNGYLPEPSERVQHE